MCVFSTKPFSCHPAKVIAMLATLIFAQPGLDWSSPIDHFETFAGKMSVTKGEIQAALLSNCLVVPLPFLILFRLQKH